MSFFMTVQQVKDRTKTQTRRYGWSNLKVGDILWAVEKAMGLKKGEKINRLGKIQITGVRQEALNRVTDNDLTKEGFSKMSKQDFIALITRRYGSAPSDPINVIDFEYIE